MTSRNCRQIFWRSISPSLSSNLKNRCCSCQTNRSRCTHLFLYRCCNSCYLGRCRRSIVSVWWYQMRQRMRCTMCRQIFWRSISPSLSSNLKSTDRSRHHRCNLCTRHLNLGRHRSSIWYYICHGRHRWNRRSRTSKNRHRKSLHIGMTSSACSWMSTDRNRRSSRSWCIQKVCISVQRTCCLCRRRSSTCIVSPKCIQRRLKPFLCTRNTAFPEPLWSL